MATTTQLEGTIMLGPDSGSAVDVSAEVFSLKLIEERSTNTRRPTFANANESERAGAYKAMFEIEFEEDLDLAASAAHKLVRDALRSDDAKLYVSGQLQPGAGQTIYAGTVVVSSVSTGGEVGSELEQSHTWTVDENGITETTSV